MGENLVFLHTFVCVKKMVEKSIVENFVKSMGENMGEKSMGDNFVKSKGEKDG